MKRQGDLAMRAYAYYKKFFMGEAVVDDLDDVKDPEIDDPDDEAAAFL